MSSGNDLSPRLQAVAAMIPNGSIPADIGSDHAHLPVALISSGCCHRVIATDMNIGPLERAREKVKGAGLTKRIELRLGNGLEVLKRGEVDVIICAGMGGQLIREILIKGVSVLASVKRLVLQPNTKADELRLWLAANDWHLVSEELIFEKKHFYPILAAERGKMELTYLEAEIGPVLLKERHPLLLPYLHKRLKTLKNAVSKMKLAKEIDHKKLNRLQTLIQELEELKRCL